MVRFTKMHGAGNDFVCLDAVAEPALARRGDLSRLARAMCDRRYGVGGDGLIVITAPRPGPGGAAGRTVGMRMFNVDGTESAMCGNGLRCVARYAVDHGLVDGGGREPLFVQTPAGAREAAVRVGPGGVEAVTIDMGRPILDLAEIPVDRGRLEGGRDPLYRIGIDGAVLEAVFVSMGNPHAVIFTGDAGAVDLPGLGPRLETHPAFPQRMNVHFVEVAGPGEAAVRTWERGSGPTGACGSGACAVCVAGVLTGRTGSRLRAHLPGGDLDLEWEPPDGSVRMTGPAVEVFAGEWKS